METMRADSLKKRYLFKVATSLVGMVCSFVTYALILRGLGPKAYGDFNFLTGFFTQIVGFLDMGTSLGFYTKLSQRPQESSMVQFYFWFAMAVSLAVMIFVVLTQPFSTHQWIWPGQQMLYVYLAALWGILMWFNQVLIQMGDAYGLTVVTEVGRMLQRVIGLILIVILFWLHELQLTNLFLYNYFIFAFLIIIILWIMRKSNLSLRFNIIISLNQVRAYIKEFYEYSHPLLTYALIGALVGIFDRWMLQYCAGSIEQGFYGFSYQIGAFCFLITGAMTPLLTREFAIAFAQKDLSLMSTLFRRYIPLLYSVVAYFSCFLAVQAHKVIYIFGGRNFSGAYSVVVIMALYPLLQTYGQLSGSVFFATGQTRLYRNIGVAFMLLGVPVTYFLIAHRDSGGLDAGATGLAVKMVLLQFIAVNVMTYFNSRLLRFRYWRYLGHQIGCVGCFLALAVIVTLGVDKMMLSSGDKVIFGFLLAGALYTLAVGVLIYFQPALLGLHRKDMESLVQLVREKWRLI